MAAFDQTRYDVRFEWGPRGVEAIGRDARAIIVVDVLRFTTTVEAAVSRGAIVYPYRWRDASAPEFAQSVGAVLAGRREEATSERPFSLSPLSMESASAGTRIVLPSPNGAEVTLAAANLRAEVLAGCLRNASAIADAASGLGLPIAIIAAGERWRVDGSLRPSLEDLLGAGAIAHALNTLRRSPEAALAAAVFASARLGLERTLLECSSGEELVRKGFRDDVACAAKYDVSDAVPHFRDRAYREHRAA